ncbi:response regulator [Caldichromatium japonicum]|uniref:histidine kinase n=1 Tax=Caldichromatium japonicum TaxID=2699430 RepID=A0A6G7VBV6_9GAMM|nr:ATP-binding protein [Caldichromatium japonicum]QIK37277.1 response regulator [Caldichromatium japonicum]
MIEEQARILVVDDTLTNVEILLGMLEDSYDTSFALSGRQALELIKRFGNPDLILLDVMMPELDGYAVCAVLKSDPATREIPVIFVTARTDVESEMRALAAGGVDFVHKPVNRAILCARIALHLELKRREQALRAANEELARHRDHLEDLISARVRELAQARDEAESANRAKSVFLTTIGHEFLTPLHQILGLAYLAKQGAQDEHARAQIDALERAAQRLHQLINNLLTLSRAESERLEIKETDFEVAALCSRVMERFAARAAAKGLALEQMLAFEPPLWVRGDDLHLEQVLDALLSNAVKFSEKGRIQLKVGLWERRPHAVRIRFVVVDQGTGLVPEIQGRLFEPFQQGDGSLNRRYEGVGLGLALARRLIKLMGGEMGVESELGQGSTFWFELRLPLGTAPTSETTAVPQASPVLEGEALRQAVEDLAHLLEQNDVTAHTLYFDAPSLYEPALKGREEVFRAALTNYDFETALAVLRAQGDAS